MAHVNYRRGETRRSAYRNGVQTQFSYYNNRSLKWYKKQAAKARRAKDRKAEYELSDERIEVEKKDILWKAF